MRRALIIAPLAVLVVLSVPAGLAYWLLCTEAGLRWTVGQTSRLKSMQLRIDGLHGTLSSTLTADRVELVHDRINLVATGVRGQLELHSLLLQTVHLTGVRVATAHATVKKSSKPPSGRPLRFIPVPWLTVRADGVAVASSTVTLPNGRQLVARNSTVDGRVSNKLVELRNWRTESLEFPLPAASGEENGTAPHIALRGSTELRAADPIGLAGDVEWTVTMTQQPPYEGRTKFDGNLARLALEGTVTKPLQAQLKGELLDLTTRWHWRSQTEVPAFNVKPWSPESTLEDAALTFEGRGDSENIHLTGTVIAPKSIPLGTVAVALDGAFAGRTLRAERLRVGLSNGTEIVSAGEIRFAGGAPTVDLEGEWSRFAWPLNKPVVRSARGEFTLKGDMPYVYTAAGTADGAATGAKLPAVDFQARGILGRKRLVVRELRTTAAGHGLIEASGALGLGDETSWRVAIDARDLNPSLFAAAYPGKISFRLEANGQRVASREFADGPWTLELIGLRGQLRNKPVSGKVVLARDAMLWDIQAATLQFGSAHLEAHGRFDERPEQQPDIRWLFSAADLGDLLPDSSGEVHFSGQLGGTHDAPKLNASLNAKDLRHGIYRARTVEGQADIDLTSALTTALSAEDAGRVQLQVEATGVGTADNTFSTAQIDLDGNTAKHVLQAVASSGERKLEVEVQGSYTPRQWQGRIEKLSFTAPRTRLALDKPVGLFVGEERLEVEPFCLLYDPQRICGQAKALGARKQPMKDFDLTGELQAQTRELGFIPALVPEIDRAAGDLDVRLKLSGKLGAPQIEGSLALEKGELDMYAVNLLMRQVAMRLELGGKTLSLKGSAQAGEGTLNVDGRLAWESGATNGNVDIKGENLLIVNVPEARVQASPNISVGIKGRDIQVDGAVRVPYARLSPANLSGAMLPSDDEMIVGTKPVDPNKSFRVTTGIHLILGKDVRVDTYGLTGRITGGIAAYTAPDEVSTAAGELQIEEGKYKAYGRELDIDRGRLIFTGGVLSNPGVDIRAIKKIEETTAGINVRGTLRDPRLSFFSEPPMPQNQVAALLITGRTFDSLQQGGGPGLGREQLLAQGGALLAKQLGGQLGIDAVSVESGANNETSLVLGKYLSPRLYVGYGISLAESINTLKLRYTLGDHWTIKMEAGEAKSTDVVYAIDR